MRWIRWAFPATDEPRFGCVLSMYFGFMNRCKRTCLRASCSIRMSTSARRFLPKIESKPSGTTCCAKHLITWSLMCQRTAHAGH